MLRSRGYLDQTYSDGVLDDDEVPKDLNRVQTACVTFARERFDILKSLSKKDIQAIVDCGCPNLFRKAVNSAKRLRAFVNVDEGDVCSACNLRGSCDRAYVNAKEEEGARTVDIVRILLSYAMDPVVLSEGGKPHGRENVEVSARKLLTELVELSDTPLDPALPTSVLKSIPEKLQKVMMGQEMKKGDWICSQCDFMNFAKNVKCLQCGEGGPKRVDPEEEMKKGDWMCPECNFMNFARNVRCLKCKEVGPKRVNFDNVGKKKGDWTCPHCRFMNFARNTNCLRCQEKQPKRQLLPGEWECPSCDFLNYRRNMVCLQCNHKRPEEKGAQTLSSRGRGYNDESKSDDNFSDILPVSEDETEFAINRRKTPPQRRSSRAKDLA
ncbi:hypothetical protein AMTR_s00060p00085440 [Amborella trichopoda]|uniref:RanBP2-type domain-containing protein n=2 Tax=Amborella trichopoda TaxID=13333 RepID=W1NK45_AMBTC|nr:hypothetical protein AMTR_s00060p00085440 [Amborella trichopoda]